MRLSAYLGLVLLALSCGGCGVELWANDERLEIVDIVAPAAVDIRKESSNVPLKLLVKNFRSADDAYIINKTTNYGTKQFSFGVVTRWRQRLFVPRALLDGEYPVEVPVLLPVGDEGAYSVTNDTGTVTKTIKVYMSPEGP